MADDSVPTAAETTTYSTGNRSGPPDLRFLHFNDVYHVEAGSQEPVGGIARFQTLCNYYKNDARFKDQPGLVTLFSGDAFNPSLESSVTKGSHMIPVLNNTGAAAACVGNHDLDFGVPQFRYLAGQCNFPWLLANVLDPALGEDVPLGNAKKTLIVTSSNGIRIGIIGLVEREWLDTINSLPPNLEYKSVSATANELAPRLRAEGAEMIICLTHQREPNDDKLARNTPPGMVDLILGGHDHYYQHSIINSTHVLRSGSDFKQLSYLEARRNANQSTSWNFTIFRRDVVRGIQEDPATVALVERLTSSLKSKLEKPIGHTAAPLDARFTTVRLKESNLGNFVCDLMRFFYQGDCCIMASGTIRGDQIYPPGILRVKDMMNCFPFEDPCVVVLVSGQAILDALENAVGKYPALEGRFPQVSGIQLTFDPSKPEGSRVSDVSVADAPIDVQRGYKLVTRDYMVRGKDGFTSLLLESDGGTAKSIVSEENGMLISMILRQYFMSLKVLGRWKNWGVSMGRQWGNVHEDLHEKHPVREPIQVNEQPAATRMPEADTNGVPSLVGKAQKKRSINGKVKHAPGEEHLHHSDSEDDDTDLPAVASEVSEQERRLIIMRKVMRKWWRLTGLQGHPAMCNEVGEEFGVHWTRGICPKLEGRIKMVSG